MNRVILKATAALILSCGTTAADDAHPPLPPSKTLVTEPARTTFPLGPVEELPEVRKHMLDLCNDVRIGLETGTLDELIESNVKPGPDRQTLSKEAGAQITTFHAGFRRMLRKKAGMVVDGFFDDMKNRAPRTATITARASHPKDGHIPYSWQVEGLQGKTSISHHAEKPVVMRKTLRLKIPGEDTILEIPLKWAGKVSLDADWNLKCDDHVIGATNTPTPKVQAERWCRPKLNVSVRCEWPVSANRIGANAPDAPASLTGLKFEEWGSGIGCNFRAGQYLVPLKASESLVLDEVPHRKDRDEPPDSPPSPPKADSGRARPPTK